MTRTTNNSSVIPIVTPRLALVNHRPRPCRCRRPLLFTPRRCARCGREVTR